MTWYHEDDEYGSAGNIPSGKGERLVLLTAITKELGMLCVPASLSHEGLRSGLRSQRLKISWRSTTYPSLKEEPRRAAP
jgi:hypothetical protein